MSEIKEQIAVGSVAFIVVIGIFVGFSLLVAWAIMVLWGAIAPQLGHRPIGFGLSFLITLALMLVTSFFNRGKK